MFCSCILIFIIPRRVSLGISVSVSVNVEVEGGGRREAEPFFRHKPMTKKGKEIVQDGLVF